MSERDAPGAENPRERKSRLEGLRQPAEARIDAVVRDHGDEEIGTDLRRLMHELRVYEIELEMQNEELSRAHVELEASRERYFDLYHEAPVGFVTFDASGVVFEANRMAAAMLGVRPDQLTGRRFTDFVEPHSRPLFSERFSKLLSMASVQPFETLLQRPTGYRVPAQLHMSLLFEDGEPGLCRLAMADMTQHAELQERISLLAAIVESSDDAIIGRDLEGRIVSWNRGAANMLGFAADEMIGEFIDTLLPPMEPAEPGWMRQLRRGEGVARFEGDLRTRDGKLLPMALTLSTTTDGRLNFGTSIIARDVSERLQAERTQQLRVRQLDLLAHTGRTLILSPVAASAFSEVFDRVRQAIRADIYFLYRPGRDGALELAESHGLTSEQYDRARVLPLGQSLCGNVGESRAPLVVTDLRVANIPGSAALRDAGVNSYAGFPLLAGGRFWGVAAFASRSIGRFEESDQKVIQAVCDQVSAMLERADLVEELRARDLLLQDADRKKDEFIATLAHELRSPLAAISSAVGILRRLKSGGDMEKAAVEAMGRQVEYTVHLVDDLLEVSRVTRGKITLRTERLELAAVLRNAANISRPLLDSRGHDLVIELPATPIVLNADAVRIEQIFANLLNNAAKFTASGGRITVIAGIEDGYAVTRVRDDGMGIAADLLPHVFDLFTQGSQSNTVQPGLGIGLTLVRTLADMHGGSVGAQSEGPGKGSEFTVRLPLAAHVATEASAPSPLTQLPSRCRILVVDDNHDTADSLGQLLGLIGAEVEVAYGGLEALEALGGFDAQVAILDLGMPEIDGYEVARRIREGPGHKAITLIALTGWGQDEDRQRTRRAGFDFHLVKPAELDALHRIIATQCT